VHVLCSNRLLPALYIYGSGLIGFAVLMSFIFMYILIVLVANHSDLDFPIY